MPKKKTDKKTDRPAPRERERERDDDRNDDRFRGSHDRNRGRGRRAGGSRKPMYSIAFSYKTNDGDWERGPSLGVWPTEIDNAIGQGSVKDTYLRDLRKFLRDADEDGGKANFTIFDNRKRQSRDRDEDEDDPDRDEPEDRDNGKDDDEAPF